MGAWDALVGALLAVLGSFVFLQARAFPTLSGGYPGPGLFPQILGGVLVVAGLSLVASGLRRGLTRRPLVTAGAREWARAGAVVLAVVLYLGAVRTLGFVLVTALLLTGLTLALGVRLRWSLLFAAGFTALLYLLFGRILHVPLPRGPLGGLW